MIGLKRSLVQVFLLALLLQFFSILSPFYMQIVVDDVLLHNDESLLAALAIGFFLLMLITTATSTLREVVLLHLSNRFSIQMSANLFRHLIRLPMSYFGKRHMGDVVSRFGSIAAIRNILTTGIVAALLDGLMAVITLGVMFYYNSALTGIVLGVLFVYILIRWAFYRPLKLLTEEQIIAAAKNDSHFMESIRGIQTLKLFQRENHRQAEWQNTLVDSMNKGIHIARWGISYNAINSILFGAQNVVVVYFAAIAVMAGDMSVGMLFAFMSYKGRFESSANSLVSQWIAFKMIDVQLDRLSDIVFTEPERIEVDALTLSSEASKNVNSSEPRLEVRNLQFKYGEQDKIVFENVNFEVGAGETVAITGPSGCGKSTLVSCLLGLLEPTSGSILMNGEKIDMLGSYRSKVAGVMQNDQLLAGSIADNIAFFSEQIDNEKVVECALKAAIHEDILSMPMQYHTLVGDMGASLSGGQIQRILLARALYREPKILFLDEATSHLDTRNESIVSENISQLKMTKIIVAHRPETIRSADREIQMESFL